MSSIGAENLVDCTNTTGAILDARARLNVLAAVASEPVCSRSITNSKLVVACRIRNVDVRSDGNIAAASGDILTSESTE